jgi:ribosomal protein S18 acetylase RimI-like enzyme
MKTINDAGPDASRITIRPARPGDHAAVMPLVRAYYRFDHIRFNPRAIDHALDQLLRSRSLGRVWIMCDGSRAVGYLVLTFNFDLEFGGLEGIVTDLFVSARYRGYGLGRRALDIVDDYCRARRIGMVELQVEKDNAAALDFYRRIGFRPLTRIVMAREVRAASRQPSASP